MEGFFTKKEAESVSRPDGRALSCISCGLYKHCTNAKMQPFGKCEKKIMIIGEAPTQTDDQRNLPFQDNTGKLLQRTLSKLGINLFEDCVTLNTTACYTPSEPTIYNIESCRRFVLQAIKDFKPKVIILLGKAPLFSVIGHRWKKDLDNINKWRGFTIPDQDYGAFICPTFSLTQIGRSLIDRFGKAKAFSVEQVLWESDLEQAIQMVDEPFRRYKEPTITYMDDLSGFAEYIGKTELAAIDYETTALKPHASRQKIVTASVAKNKDEVCVFPFPQDKYAQRPFVRFLLNSRIFKMAHNMKFEENWSIVKLGVGVTNWYMDTMISTHIIDNRSYITGLKFQTYVQFGIIDYSSEIEPYLKGLDSKDANSTNRIEEFMEMQGGTKKVLTYNALDSIYEYRLALLQQKVMNYNFDLPF